MRMTLIITGVPLAFACLGFGFWLDSMAATLGAMGAYTALRTIDLIYDHQ